MNSPVFAKTTSAFFVAFSLSSFPSTQASANAIRAPVICSDLPSCGEDISLADAANSYAKHAQSPCLQGPVTEVPQAQKPAKQPTDIDHLDVQKLLSGGECYSEQSSANEAICGSQEVLGFYYFWAPADRFRNGAAELEKVMSRAKTGDVSFSTQIVEETTSSASERHLALCEVTVVEDQHGPPRDCTTVAIITPTRSWLRGGGSTFCYTAGSIRLSGAMDVLFEMKSYSDLESMSHALSKMLREQLGLAVLQSEDKDEHGHLLSIEIESSAGMRLSKILSSGWRDSLDFDLSIRPEPDFVQVRGTAHAMVSQQNLPNLSDYAGLSDAQRTVYIAALNSDVAAALKSVCSRSQQPDDKTIICKSK